MSIRKRRSAMALAMTLAVTATTLIVSSPAFANVTVTTLTSGLNVRDCYHPAPKAAYPGYSCTTIVASLENNLSIRLVCQYPGDGVGPQNDYYWDYILYPATSSHGSGEGYVTDWYVNTGVPSPPFRDTRVPICNY